MTEFGIWAMRAIGAAYLGLGIWCTAAPQAAAEWVGFTLEGGSGLSEFVTVYGGLEVGLGLALLVTSFVPELRAGGLVSGALISIALPLFRAVTLVKYDVGPDVYKLFTVEILFAVALAVPALAAVARS